MICTVEVLSVEQLTSVDWDQIALVLWQAPLPSQNAASQLQSFVERGGQVTFFPPRNPNGTELFGIKWQAWTENPDDLTVETWRGDEDLLLHTLSGVALPVGQLEIHRACGLTGEYVSLASLRSGAASVGSCTNKTRRRLLLGNHSCDSGFLVIYQRSRSVRICASLARRRSRRAWQSKTTRCWGN